MAVFIDYYSCVSQELQVLYCPWFLSPLWSLGFHKNFLKSSIFSSSSFSSNSPLLEWCLVDDHINRCKVCGKENILYLITISQYFSQACLWAITLICIPHTHKWERNLKGAGLSEMFLAYKWQDSGKVFSLESKLF